MLLYHDRFLKKTKILVTTHKILALFQSKQQGGMFCIRAATQNSQSLCF